MKRAMLSVLAVVLTHAHVLTMSPAQPTATTLAVVDGRVAYVGDDEAAARRAAGPDAAELDVGGRTIMPGFNDAHVHFGVAITFGGSKGIDVPELPAKKWLAAVAEAARIALAPSTVENPGVDYRRHRAPARNPGVDYRRHRAPARNPGAIGCS